MFRVYFKQNEYKDIEALTSIEAMTKAGITPATQASLWAIIDMGNEALPNDTFTILQRGQKVHQAKLGELSLTVNDAFRVLAIAPRGFARLVWLGDQWVETRRLRGLADSYLSKTFPYTYSVNR